MRFGLRTPIVSAVVLSMFVLSAHAQQETSAPLTSDKRSEIGKQILKAKKPEERKATDGKLSVKTKSAVMRTSGSRSEAEQAIMKALDFKTVSFSADGEIIEYTHMRGKISGCKLSVTETIKVKGYPARLYMRYTLDFADLVDLDVVQPEEEVFAVLISTGSTIMQEVADNSEFRSTERKELEDPMIFTKTFKDLESVSMAIAYFADSCR